MAGVLEQRSWPAASLGRQSSGVERFGSRHWAEPGCVGRFDRSAVPAQRPRDARLNVGVST